MILTHKPLLEAAILSANQGRKEKTKVTLSINEKGGTCELYIKSGKETVFYLTKPIGMLGEVETYNELINQAIVNMLTMNINNFIDVPHMGLDEEEHF